MDYWALTNAGAVVGGFGVILAIAGTLWATGEVRFALLATAGLAYVVASILVIIGGIWGITELLAGAQPPKNEEPVTR